MSLKLTDLKKFVEGYDNKTVTVVDFVTNENDEIVVRPVKDQNYSFVTAITKTASGNEIKVDIIVDNNEDNMNAKLSYIYQNKIEITYDTNFYQWQVKTEQKKKDTKSVDTSLF